MIRRALTLFALTATLPTAALAADSLGDAGYLTELQVNQTSSDTYLQFHGRAFIGNRKSPAVEYRWGGSSCGTKTLSEHQVTLLMRAMDGGLEVEPLYHVGQGSAHCLVGFRMRS